MVKSGVLLFDVNETLIDLSPVRAEINGLVGSPEGFRSWFGMLLHTSVVENTIGRYHDFSFLALSSLEVVARSFQVTTTRERLKNILSLMHELKAYQDVAPGLQVLKEKGFRLATLTNSPSLLLNRQLENSGIRSFFEQALSVDTVQLYKPAPKTYQWACRELAVEPGNTLMVAAHAWDLAGAAAAGLKTCFVERPGQFLHPAYVKPVYSGPDLMNIAEQL